MKTCPYCAEEIKDAAIRCRWCLTWLVDEVPEGAEGPPPGAAEARDREEEAPEPVPSEAIVQPVPSEAKPSEPSAATASAPAAAGPAAATVDAKVEFTHTGSRYLLGYGTDYFGIWDRNAPQQPIERFPRNDQGWASAWQRYASIENTWMDLRTGQRSS